jgi:RHS repeat-associated protein
VEDARWLYTWDAENRLARMEEKGFGVAAGLDPATAPKRLRLEFGYDAQHRRIAKVVRRWESQTNTFSRVVKSRRYVYDGWNMIAELDHLTATGTGLAGATVVRTQVWGLDLSGTPQGAGGVGGLLAVRHNGQSYAPLLDGNGNVMGLVGLGGAIEGEVVARYDYDAFGNRITNTAPQLGEEVNPFGFSTKFTDEETGLVYYGYRYYDPVTGRWPSRDPIGERGGLNLYGMVGNDAVNGSDMLGLQINLTGNVAGRVVSIRKDGCNYTITPVRVELLNGGGGMPDARLGVLAQGFQWYSPANYTGAVGATVNISQVYYGKDQGDASSFLGQFVARGSPDVSAQENWGIYWVQFYDRSGGMNNFVLDLERGAKNPFYAGGRQGEQVLDDSPDLVRPGQGQSSEFIAESWLVAAGPKGEIQVLGGIKWGFTVSCEPAN